MGITVPRSLALDSVSSAQRTFTFAQSLEIEVACEEGVWALRHVPSDLNSYGETLEEALERFAEDVAYAWDTYAMQADSELGVMAQKTKRALREIVAQVLQQ